MIRLTISLWRAHPALRVSFRELYSVQSDDKLRGSGIPAGPAMGKILQALLVSVLHAPDFNRTDWLLQEAQRIFAASRPRS